MSARKPLAAHEIDVDIILAYSRPSPRNDVERADRFRLTQAAQLIRDAGLPLALPAESEPT
jgi:hypothetical protein